MSENMLAAAPLAAANTSACGTQNVIDWVAMYTLNKICKNDEENDFDMVSGIW